MMRAMMSMVYIMSHGINSHLVHPVHLKYQLNNMIIITNKKESKKILHHDQKNVGKHGILKQ